ncbi:MAG: branched-chain amino acid transport system permease protein [Paracoccaceae bacterium]|jgi:branched-chain amino acid transport system permease protein
MTDTTATTTRAQSDHFMQQVTMWVVAAIVLMALPLIFNSGSSLTIMNQMAITVVFALAYNMLLGQGGMLSFGHAVYMGLGGFMVMHLMNYIEMYDLPIPLPVLPIFGGLFGMAVAALIGLFQTRNAGTVFAMISLGVGELIAACSIIITAFFGGEEGISGDRTMGLPTFGVKFLHQIEVYYLIAFWMFLSALGMFLYSRTPVGRMANAVRDNPERAEFLGYSARWVRYCSFVFSGFFCGVAGALFAINYEILTEENLNLATSGTILLVAFLGGVGIFAGPIVGAVVFTLLQTVMSLHTELWALYLGSMFVATVMFFPQGLTGLIMMHGGPMKLGNMGKLVVPYFKTILPGMLGLLGVMFLMEIVFHARHASVGDDMMSIFGVDFSSHSPVAWIVCAVMAVAGIWIAKTNAPELRQTWHEANTPGGAK